MPANLDLQYFKKRINLGSAGQGLKALLTKYLKGYESYWVHKL